MFQGGLKEAAAQMRAECPKGAENCTCAEKMELGLLRRPVLIIRGDIAVPLEILVMLMLMPVDVRLDSDQMFNDLESQPEGDVLDLGPGSYEVFIPRDQESAFVPIDLVKTESSTKVLSSSAADTRPLWQKLNQHPSGPVRVRGSQVRGGRFVG